MLKAAYDLFCRHGWAGTTMNAIAEEAGVAVQTLYFTFHTKAAILSETFGAALVGFERWEPLEGDPILKSDLPVLRQIHPWFREVEAAKTASAALAIFI